MTKPRMPGVVSDPWRNAPAVSDPAPEAPSQNPVTSLPFESAGDTDDFATRFTTIELPGYGGITVEGTQNVPIAVLQLLNFCVQEKAAVEDILAEYGVVITKLPRPAVNHLKFYIQRTDGWLLAIPLARTRDAGSLQLIQGFMRLYSIPELRPKLVQYKIKPYKI